MTGSAHDATAFEHTGAVKHPEWLFEGEEFAWADSAYAVNAWTIPVHKKPASLNPVNTFFDMLVAHLHVWSEHCMGALKGHFQSLCGLQISINSKKEHYLACHWITIAIILHNLVIDVEGSKSGTHFATDHSQAEEYEDRGGRDGPLDVDNIEAKRQELVAEAWAFKDM